MHISMLFGHLGENLHPTGRSVGSGISPGIAVRRSVTFLIEGIEFNSPVV